MNRFRPALRCLIWSLSVAVAAQPPDAGKWSQEPQEPASGQVHALDQFVITLPTGWYVHDQNAAIGRPGPHGVVVFAPVDLGKMSRAPMEEEARKAFIGVSSGEVASFFVDRYTAPKGMTCRGEVSKKLRSRLIEDYKNSARGRVANTMVGTPEVERVAVGGCQGLRVRLSASVPGEGQWDYLIYALSDGQTAYDFTLRNQKEFFEKNLPMFEKAVSSIVIVVR